MANDIVSLEADCPLRGLTFHEMIQDNAAAVLNGVTVDIPVVFEWDSDKTNNVFVIDDLVLGSDTAVPAAGTTVELDALVASGLGLGGTSLFTTKPKLANGAGAWDVTNTAHAGITVGVIDTANNEVPAGSGVLLRLTFTNAATTMGNVHVFGSGHWKNQRNQ